MELIFGKKYRELVGEEIARAESQEAFGTRLQPVGGSRRGRHVSITERAEYDDDYDYKRGLMESVQAG